MKKPTLLKSVFTLSFMLLSATASAEFITDENRADIAYDTVRQVLYISGGQTVRRYDMVAKKFLAPITLGGTTLGMDISPDGKLLAVANTTKGTNKNFIDLINLRTLVPKRVSFGLSFNEGGTYTVAFDEQSNLLVSSVFEGSGWVPLRKYNIFSQKTTVLGSIRHGSMLTPSFDRKRVAIAEADISSGDWGVYKVGDEKYASTHTTEWFNFEIGISYTGSQIIVPTYNGAYVKDATKTFPNVGEYAGVAPIGVSYAPASNNIYFPMALTDHISIYNMANMTEIGTYKVPGTFDWTGNSPFVEGRTKVATDNSFLFSTLDKGIFYQALRTPAQ